MWIDDRGSEVLALGECRRLLALGAKTGLHGHLGIAKEGAPLILPVDFTTDGSDVIVRVGDHVFDQIDGALVAFQVDNAGSPGPVGDEGRWSVLVRGFVDGGLEPSGAAALPHPRVAEPGQHLVCIRGDVVTGRRLRPPASPGAAPA
jgi:hypothetical protein